MMEELIWGTEFVGYYRGYEVGDFLEFRDSPGGEDVVWRISRIDDDGLFAIPFGVRKAGRPEELELITL